METKNKSYKLERLRRSLNFPCFEYVEPVGLSGGLTLWWKEEANLLLLDKSKNLINVKGRIHHQQE